MKRLRSVDRSTREDATCAILALTTATLLAGLSSLAGCETTEGLGRDMQNLGDNIEEAAEENDVE